MNRSDLAMQKLSLFLSLHFPAADYGWKVEAKNKNSRKLRLTLCAYMEKK